MLAVARGVGRARLRRMTKCARVSSVSVGGITLLLAALAGAGWLREEEGFLAEAKAKAHTQTHPFLPRSQL